MLRQGSREKPARNDHADGGAAMIKDANAGAEKIAAAIERIVSGHIAAAAGDTSGEMVGRRPVANARGRADSAARRRSSVS